MTLIKTSPHLATMKQDLDRVFERFFEPAFWPVSASRSFEPTWEPKLDFSETSKEFVIRLEAPGMTRDDFDVALDGSLLTLSGKRDLHKEEKGEDYIWQERHEGRFLRTIRLPVNVKEDKVEASYTNGLLTVKIPKAEQVARTRVTIK